MTLRRRSRVPAAYASVVDLSARNAWTFPLVLAAGVVIAVWAVVHQLELPEAPLGPALVARLTWGLAAMLFAVFFVFSVIELHVLMFRCGREQDAQRASLLTTIAGVTAVLVAMWNADLYLGPTRMATLLESSAFALTGVKRLSAIFDGFALWAALLVLATSSVILRHEVTTQEDLSRQLRASRILLYVGSALLVTGVSQSVALHTWPACCPPSATPPMDTQGIAAFQAEVRTSAEAVGAAAGTVCSLVLAAAYLPLGVMLRQRAYRVVKPWERAESWLAVHGLSLQPTQQLAKVLMILAPLLAGGPVSFLVGLLSR